MITMMGTLSYMSPQRHKCVCLCACAEAAHVSAACQADFKARLASFCSGVFAEVCVQRRQHPASSCLLSLSKCQPHLPQQSDRLKTEERESVGSTASALTPNRRHSAAVYQQGLSEI